MPTSIEELQDTIEAALTLAGVDAGMIERHPRSTIVPESRRIDTGGERAFSLLKELRRTESVETEKLELHGTIGEGGMGVVRLGTQRSLGRAVAVKTLKPEHRNDRATMKLLREAWVTGGLEHPNVVPVYDIALEADGSPLIVLKKIEGDEWALLMHDADAVKKRFGVDDLLDWNLRIFMQVCNAVRFAHSHGVLHRDLKPENVMIGRFGEVYLVDWGIAVSLRDDGTGRLPLAADATEMAGTPMYMAPEMLGGKEGRLSERTDVYLLGAVLHEIVSGHPPHRGEALMELVASIVESSPELPAEVPPEVARIVRHAMQRDPDARFENAEQIRLSVQAFLEHRDAARLAQRAHERLSELEALLEAHVGRRDDPESREPIYHLFGECRFGFRHALEVWADNDDARAGLERAIASMVEYELSQNEPEAARALLGEMRSATPELALRVEQARASRDEEDAELRRLHADLDPSAGRRTRAFLAMVVGLIWVVSPLVAGLLVRAEVLPFEREGIALFTVAILVLLGGFGVWARESLTRTAINRRIGIAAVLAMGMQLVLALVGGLSDQPAWAVVHDQLPIVSAILAMVAAAVDWRIAISAAAFLAGYVVLPFVGMSNVLFVLSACNVVLLLNVSFLWYRVDDFEAASERLKERRAARRKWLAARFGRRGDASDAP